MSDQPIFRDHPEHNAPKGFVSPPPPPNLPKKVIYRDVESDGSMTPQAGWTLFSFIGSVVIGVIVGFWQDDWPLAGLVAGGLYTSALLTIIAAKD